jgi:hypothetical protein
MAGCPFFSKIKNSVPEIRSNNSIELAGAEIRCKSPPMSHGTLRHFAAQQNLVAIGVIADIGRATPIERALSSAIKSPSGLDT